MQTQLTFLQEDSLASPTAQPANGLAKRMNATYGPKCLEQLEKFNRVGLWAKTFSALLIGQGDWYSTRCKLTWKLRGTKFGRMYFQLAPKMLPTEGTEFGLLPTPLATDTIETPEARDVTWKGNSPRIMSKQGTDGQAKLSDLAQNRLLPTPDCSDRRSAKSKQQGLSNVIKGMLPTPRACESIERRNWKTVKDKVENGGDVTLTTLAKYQDRTGSQMLPTPTANNWRGSVSEEAMTRKDGKTRDDSLQNLPAMIGQPGQLSPLFVMEMMGFPSDWTQIPFLKVNGEMRA
jgi:hypothetical protein